MTTLAWVMRAALVGLVASAGVACSTGSSSGPAVQAGVTVGVVVEIGGTVTATRGGQTRPLEAGDEISGDDVIATGANGTVGIELAHNGARWNLGASKRGQVSESVAWGLPKRAAPAGVVSHDTSAAGRHSEHSAADTAASATLSKERALDPKLDAKESQDRHTETAAAEAAARLEAERAAAAQQLRRSQSEKSENAERIAAAKQAAQRAERVKGVKLDKACLENPLGCSESSPKPPPPPPPPTSAPTPQPAVDLVAAGKAKVAGDAAMRACLGTAATSHVVIRCEGPCAITSATNVDAAGRRCLDARLGALTLASGAYTIVLELAAK